MKTKNENLKYAKRTDFLVANQRLVDGKALPIRHAPIDVLCVVCLCYVRCVCLHVVCVYVGVEIVRKFASFAFYLFVSFASFVCFV